MRVIRILLAAVLVFSSVRGFSQASDAEIIKKLNRVFLDAIVNRDTTALGNILADDFMLINPGGMKRNKADNLAGLLMQNQRVDKIDIDSVLVKMLSGEVGLIAAWTTNVITAEGKTTTLKICYQDVYMKRAGGWKAVAAHVTLLDSKEDK